MLLRDYRSTDHPPDEIGVSDPFTYEMDARVELNKPVMPGSFLVINRGRMVSAILPLILFADAIERTKPVCRRPSRIQAGRVSASLRDNLKP